MLVSGVEKSDSKTPNSESNLEKRKTELEESGSLTSDYTTKLQSSRQYGGIPWWSSG